MLSKPGETIGLMKNTGGPGGLIIIDDAYLSDGAARVAYNQYEYLKRSEWHDIIHRSGVRLVEEIRAEGESSADSYASDMQNIRARAGELKVRYPEHGHLFDSYVASQEDEYRDLEQALTGVLLLLRT